RQAAGRPRARGVVADVAARGAAAGVFPFPAGVKAPRPARPGVTLTEFAHPGAVHCCHFSTWSQTLPHASQSTLRSHKTICVPEPNPVISESIASPAVLPAYGHKPRD